MLSWTTERPDYACVFLSRHKYKGDWEYSLWSFEWLRGEPPENADDDVEYYYLAWVDNDGGEWDDIKDCSLGEYFILEILPTMKEVHRNK